MKKIIIKCQNCGYTSFFDSLSSLKLSVNKPCIECKEIIFTKEEYNYIENKINFYNTIKNYNILKDFDIIIDQILKFKI